jgi:hypothetical protein
MLSRFDLCRDVAEFAVFSLAIRAGALTTSAPPAPAKGAVTTPAEPDSPAPVVPAGAPAPRSRLWLGVGIAVVALALVGVISALIALLLLR